MFLWQCSTSTTLLGGTWLKCFIRLKDMVKNDQDLKKSGLKLNKSQFITVSVEQPQCWWIILYAYTLWLMPLWQTATTPMYYLVGVYSLVVAIAVEKHNVDTCILYAYTLWQWRYDTIDRQPHETDRYLD